MAPRILDEPGTREYSGGNVDDEVNPEDRLLEIEKNLPKQVCPAHSLLILYIQDMNRTMKDNLKTIGDKVDALEEKIDNLTRHVSKEQGKDEEKDKNEERKFKVSTVVLSGVIGFVFGLILMVFEILTHIH
ncbi:MAG: hypothetical protein ABFC34_08100 [Methanobacterium sp.]